MFSLAKERMYKSKLWNIVRRMPKGALLHCHLEAMVDLDWALEEACATDGVCIRSGEPLTSPGALKKANISFTYSKTRAKADMSIWSSQYVADSPIPINTAADSFPDGGRKGFIEWVRSRTTITDEEHLLHHQGPNEIWRKFMSCFPILGSLVYYEPIFRKFIRKMCKQLLDDGVYYVDIRAAFHTPYRSLGQENWDEGYPNFMGHMEEEIENFKNSEEGKEFWGARLIWTTLRSFGTPIIIDSMFFFDNESRLPALADFLRYEAVHRNEARVSRLDCGLRPSRTRRCGSLSLRPYA
jgi:adenosine deaminase CECR1